METYMETKVSSPWQGGHEINIPWRGGAGRRIYVLALRFILKALERKSFEKAQTNGQRFWHAMATTNRWTIY